MLCIWEVSSYKNYLKDGGAIYQKTDDFGLFNYSFSKFVEYGFRVEDVSKEINEETISNVETEYEKKFKAQGLKVYALIATK